MTEVFGYIRHTLFNNDGIPYPDMRAVANEEFKAAGELMACSLIQGGPAPSFLSANVYNYIVDGVSSVKSSEWVTYIDNNDLKNCVDKVQLFHVLLLVS